MKDKMIPIKIATDGTLSVSNHVLLCNTIVVSVLSFSPFSAKHWYNDFILAIWQDGEMTLWSFIHIYLRPVACGYGFFWMGEGNTSFFV